MSILRNFFFAAAVLLALGCGAHSGGSVAGDHAYGSDAKENYELGMKALDGKDWLEAERYLEFVSAKFPYSTFSALSDLALADLNYQQEKYVEAVDKYRSFIKLHPTHPKDGYASFQIAMSYYEQIPGDFIILPDSAEKDQTDVHNALQSFNEFMIQYPTSDLRPQASTKIQELRHRLADHDMRIAAFYLNHDRPKAAVGRYESVLKDYSGSGFDGDAALRLYRVYKQLDEGDKAKATLERLVKEHPDDPKIAEARKLLGAG